MNNNPTREEMTPILQLAATKKLTLADLEGDAVKITLNLNPDWFRPDGTRITIREMAQQVKSKRPGVMFVTLDLS
jgi:hypothetical protein